MDIYTAALFVVAVVSLIGNGIFANSLRTRNRELDDAVCRYDDKADECEQLTESVEKWKAQYIQSENSKRDMYYRNGKGQIVPVKQELQQPNTLKYGMTVKDPTPKQAERIFKEAKKAGIQGSDGKDPQYPWITFNGMVRGRTNAPLTKGMSFITATEFVKRIKGEIS